MVKKFFSVISLLVFTAGSQAFGQEVGTVQGTVSMTDGTKLPGVTVSLKEINKNTATNENGEYSFIGIKQGIYTLITRLDGFTEQMKTIIVQAGRTTVVDFTLEMAKLSEEVTVTADRPLLSTTETVSTITLAPRQIAILPSLGEKDVFRAFQLLPGISGSNETSSGLYVRGGTPDQNLISYDGFTIYHVDHLFGYFSAFNMEAVKDIRLTKGGYESKYGGRLSSIMELTGNTGDPREFNFGAGISLLSFNGLVEVPLFNKGSFFIAGRHSFQSPLYDSILDLFDTSPTGPGAASRPSGRTDGGGRFAAMFDTQPSSYFYDINAKLSLTPTKTDNFTLSLYNGKDDLDNSRTLEIPAFMLERMAELGIEIEIEGNIEIIDLTEWGNMGVSAAWKKGWGWNFQSSLVVAYSNYFNNRDRSSQGSFMRTPDPDSGEEPETRSTRGGLVEDNNVKDITFKLDNALQIHQNNRLEFGVQVTSNDIRYDYDMDTGQDENEGSEDSGQGLRRNLVGILDREDRGTQSSAYIQGRWALFNRLTLTPGFRVTYFDLTEDVYYEPRLSMSFKLSDKIKIKGAWGKYNQYISRITREDLLQGNREFWALSDGSTIPIASAVHYIGGLSYETGAYLFDVEVYYKDLNGLSEFAFRLAPEIGDVDYNQFFYQGTGVAKGLEFLLQKKYGRFYGWICYTLSRVEYDFPDLSPNPYPALHDQTHEFKIVGVHEFGNWIFSSTWIYATGKPYTEPIGVEEVAVTDRLTINQVVVGEKNGARLPDYHRMDFSVSYKFKIGENDCLLGATLFNLYNRKNVWYKEFDVVEGELIENNILLMGLTLNLFFNIKF